MSLKGSITTSDYLPFEDYRRLVQSLVDEKKYWWASYCILSFCTGLRYSDVSRIKWDDFLEQKRIVITAQKTKKTHLIPIGKNASEHMTALYKKMGCPAKTNYILDFGRKENGKPITIQSINRELKKWKIKYHLDIENFSTHTFRKTFGRYVYEKGGCTEKSLLYLNQIFKHASITTTKIYLGIRDQEISEIFNSIEI